MDGFEAAAPQKLVYPFGDPPAPGAMSEVADGVYWIRMPLPFILKAINLWALRDGDGWTLIDCGLALEESRNYWRELFAGALEGRAIKRVICTHMHPDHVGLAGWITRKFAVDLWMTRLEYITCRMLVADTGRAAPEAGIAFYRAAGWDEEALAHYRARFGGFGKAVSTLPDAYRRICDGEEIAIDGRSWRVICGSGHSPEHACLYQPDMNVLISGDQVLPRISSNVSVFPTEPEADPLGDWIASCHKLKAALPADCLVLPSHNEPFYGLHTRLEGLLSGHQRSLERLAARLDAPKTAVETFGALFARPISGDLLGMATGEAIAHLNHLRNRGEIERFPDDGLWRYQRR